VPGLLLVLLTLVAVFLILLVLVQRGRGGGLAGALGGMGGQSAFGAKAGDTFTKITMWTAFLWIVLCVVSVKMLSSENPVDDAADGFNAVPGAAPGNANDDEQNPGNNENAGSETTGGQDTGSNPTNTPSNTADQ